MKEDDEEKPRRPLDPAIGPAIGEPLDGLSIGELDARLDLLRREVERLEAERARKQAAASAADAFFRK